MRLAIIIPVFNEGPALAAALDGLTSFVAGGSLDPLGYERIDVVLVDDGSRTPVRVEPRPAPRLHLHLLRHLINLGQGAALQTGVTYACDTLRSDEFVTMDSDGQHRPQDLPTLLGELRRSGARIVFGDRFSSSGTQGIPASRRIILRAAAAFEVLLTGVKLNDAHNGFRAFDRSLAESLDLKQNRMAHATEFKQHLARTKATYSEAPVAIAYSQESLAKGQRNTGSLVILKDLLASYLFGR